MYQGRHITRKKKTKFRKPLILLASTAVLLCAMVGGTLAWLTSTTEDVTNTFTPAHVTCAIDENFDGTTKENVQIKNTGDIDAYIRARVVVSWKDSAGNIFGQTPTSDEYYVDYVLGNDWQAGGDGYYYYTSKVAPGSSTSVLISKAGLKGDEPSHLPDGYSLSVEIIAEAIQAEGVNSKGESAVYEAWGFNPKAK